MSILGQEHVKRYFDRQMQMLKRRFDSIETSKKQFQIILLGHDADTMSYCRAIEKDCSWLGIEVIKGANDYTLPIPTIAIGDNTINNHPILPIYNVDNIGISYYEEYPIGQGICDYLETMVSLRESIVTIIGRGQRAGRPIINSLIIRGATTICCNSKTDSFKLKDYMRDSDIIITAINQSEFFNLPPAFPDRGIIIDCGCFWNEDKKKLVGNIEEETLDYIDQHSLMVVKPIGGVGLLTRIGLFKNVYRSILINETKDITFSNFNDWD